MNTRGWIWILAPLALSAGVILLSAQEPKGGDGLKLGELAEKLQQREKTVARKESELQQLEQRLGVLQAALDRDRQELQARERSLQDAVAKFEAERTRPVLDPQIVRTYEAMDPAAGAKALGELAQVNFETASSLLAAMAPKKAGKLLDQVEPRLAGRLSERVARSRDVPKGP
ncbi:MAG: hypothetical protein HY823_01250 [Acidobacteria bacterium]|nr:hypothetical protein [Acidobacteriota bacterium]